MIIIKPENIIVGIVLVVLAVTGIVASSETGFSATEGTTTVTATVGASISCSLSTSTVVFGTLSVASVNDAWGSTTMLITTNSTAFIKVYDKGDTSDPGLYYAGGPDLIGSANAAGAASSSLVAGTEGFGMQATSSDGNMRIKNRYHDASTTDIVGGLELYAGVVTLASSTAAVTNERILMYHKAAISSANLAGVYTDDLNYLCSTSL